jgi:ubiquitin carboxyl-terminal hydrolase 5/13
MDDPDFNNPLPTAGSTAGAESFNPESMMMLQSMGFTEKACKKALSSTGGDVERAAEWLFSRSGTGELEALENESKDSGKPKAKGLDGEGKYELFGIISHIGTNTGNGHYVCHLKKDGVWAIFNDNKVAKSENPPFDLGYLYFFKRVDHTPVL